jgi:hypothetical protein
MCKMSIGKDKGLDHLEHVSQSGEPSFASCVLDKMMMLSQSSGICMGRIHDIPRSEKSIVACVLRMCSYNSEISKSEIDHNAVESRQHLALGGLIIFLMATHLILVLAQARLRAGD